MKKKKYYFVNIKNRKIITSWFGSAFFKNSIVNFPNSKAWLVFLAKNNFEKFYVYLGATLVVSVVVVEVGLAATSFTKNNKNIIKVINNWYMIPIWQFNSTKFRVYSFDINL